MNTRRFAGGNVGHDGHPGSILRALPGLPAVRRLQRRTTAGRVREALFLGDAKRCFSPFMHWVVRAHGRETGETAVVHAAVKRRRRHASRVADRCLAPVLCISEFLEATFVWVQPGSDRIAWLAIDDPFC